MKILNKHEITVAPFLSDEYVEGILKKVNELEEDWILRGDTEDDRIGSLKVGGPQSGSLPPGLLYTIGRTTYLDAEESGMMAIDDDLIKNNNIILDNFRDLLDITTELLENMYEEEFIYDGDSFTLPGFHIFKDIPEEHMPSYHFDLHYRHLDFSSYGIPDENNTLSFTVPILIPPQGAGLETLDIDYEDVKNSTPEAVMESYKGRPPLFRYTPYEEGDIIVHDGKTFHKISWNNNNGSGTRLTFQGSAIKCGNTWVIYW